MKNLLLITILLCLSLGACTLKSCPTYSFSAPIEKQPKSKWDTVPATYADLAEYMANDTTSHRFSRAEKIGALIATVLIVKAISSQKE